MSHYSALARTFSVLLCFHLFSGNNAAVARFSDDRCEADGVCPSDPLTFTCVINGALNLRVQLPNGHDETVSLGNGPEDVDLPDGFTAVTLAITEIDSSTRDFLLTLSIAEASLLAGGEIRCDDTIPGNGNAVMAGCPILASPTPSNLSHLLSSNTPTTATITWDSVDNAVSYTVRSASLQSPVTGIEEDSYTLTGLELETDYTVSVTATNECGEESPPQNITVRIDVQAPEAPTLADPLIDCSDNDETMALVEISWMYGESRPTAVSGLVDVPVTGVEVSYRDSDGSNKNACVGVSDAVCTCGSVSVADTSCSLYLPLRDGLQYEEDDVVTIVVQVTNGKTTESEIMLDARPVLADGNLDSGGDSLSVPVMVNPLCTVAEYPVLVTFGAEENDNGICQGQRNATLMSLASGESATFSVDRDVVTLRDNEEYCYIVSISGETDDAQCYSTPTCGGPPIPSLSPMDCCVGSGFSYGDSTNCQICYVISGCPYGTDDVWDILWPNTPGGSINTQPCPGGVDTSGTATRECYENGTWGQPNVLSCQSLEILRVLKTASELLPESDAEIEEVTPELIASVSVVSEMLVVATDSEEETGLLPLDLDSSNSIVLQVLNVLESSVEEEIDDVVNEELVEVFNNLLNETNQVGWTELQSIEPGSQTLLQNAERYGRYLASTVNDTDDPVVLVRENIIVAAEVVDMLNVSDIVFPANPDQLGNFTATEMDDTAQIIIPADALARLNAGNNNSDLVIVHIIFRNIENFLPVNTSGLSNSRAASIVISSQFNQRVPDDVFMDNPITLNFNFTTGVGRVNQYYVGVFWNFSDPVGSGGWSSEGIQVISNVTRGSVTTVQCNSTHLTSFAVLVDVSGGLEHVTVEEELALQVVSYIGCIISSICLSITVVFYLAMGKKLFSAVHYFVHLNLAISLLLGYVVFMFGIELGTSTKGGCAFVAALLQYLFLSAFCWMMCEGIMLYLMLVVVFTKLTNKWWYFLLLGYGTPLLFVVVSVASRTEYYGVRGDDDELAFCWLSTKKGTIFAFVAPMTAIILINTVFLGFALVALRRIYSKKQNTKAMDKNKSIKQATTILRATLILLPLLGLTWLFGVLTLSNNATVFAWLFTIFNSLQGAAIFFFHVIRHEKVWTKISSRLPRLKQRIFKSTDVSTFYSGSVGQHSTVMTRTHEKPHSSSNDDVAASGQAMSSVVNDSLSFELTRHRHGQHNHGDYIPEEGRNMGGGEVIHNPNTSI